MRTLSQRLVQTSALILLMSAWPLIAISATSPHNKETQDVEQLEGPMYNPFVERYVMDELRQLRVDMNDMHVQLTKEVVNRELTATSRAVGYATDTVTYFFYLIAGISSVLLLVGWSSIRDIKVKVHDLADTKVNKVIATYEERLKKLEEELQRKSRGITSAQKRLSQHQDIHSLWLKAGQEQILSNRMTIYDQILELDPANVEAMTYKADAALEMNEPQWAINLCNQALRMDPENKHAFYQLAGAYAQLDKSADAIEYLKVALEGTEGYKDQVKNDPVFSELRDNPEFQQLIADDMDDASEKKPS
jgi:tetratricopeptide (TPR) repeat protein